MFAWQATVQDEAGNVVPFPVVTVYEGDGETLASIFEEDGSPLENPFTGTMEGFVQFWAEPGKYRVSGVSGSGETQEWRIEGGGVELGLDALTAFETRADMVAALDGLSGSQDGRVVWAGGLAYIRDSGSDDIPDLPGWRPVGVAEVANFGGDISSAHAGGGPIDYGSHLWDDDETNGYYNLYGPTKYKTASLSRVQLGRNISPVNDPKPVTAVVKFSSADRSEDSKAWDQTGYYGLVKVGGDAYCAALSADARARGGSGDVVGVHGRAQAFSRDADVFGGWFYAVGGASGWHPSGMHGIEIDLNNLGDDAQWPPTPAAKSFGLAITTADGGGRCHSAVYVHAGSGTGGFMAGWQVTTNTIAGDAESGSAPTANIMLAGKSANNPSVGAPMGIRFVDSYYRSAIDMSEVPVNKLRNGTAFILPQESRIRYGGETSSRWIGQTANNMFNFENMNIQINGVKVLGAQHPAIPNAASGTEVATINAILTVLRGHGLIAT